MTEAEPLPQIPVEVWERIIDSILDHYGDHDRDALRACCLTCRAWVLRCRFHLYDSVTLRSKQHLTHVLNTFATSPTLCARVRTLAIVGGDHDDISWISVVPLQLAPKLKFLECLWFCNVDFRKTNSRFQACFSLFRPIPRIAFEDIQWSQLSQIIRLASAVRAGRFSVRPFRFDVRSLNAEAPNNVTANPITLPSSQRLVLRHPDLRFIDVDLPPGVLSRISQSWSFPAASLYGVFVRTDWPGRTDSGWTTHLDTLRRILNLFQQICASNSIHPRVFCIVEYWLPPGSAHPLNSKCHLLLQRDLHDDDGDSPGGDKLSLELTYHLDTTNHNDFTSAARFLSIVARARPHAIKLQLFDRDMGATHPDQMAWTPANDLEPMANLLARWKCIDDILSSDAFADVTSVSVTAIPHYHLGDFDCVNTLTPQLLPRLAARGIISPCVHDNLCIYHEPEHPRYNLFRTLSILVYYEPEDIAGPQSVANTSSLDIEDLAFGRLAEVGSVAEMGEGGMEDGSLPDNNAL